MGDNDRPMITIKTKTNQVFSPGPRVFPEIQQHAYRLVNKTMFAGQQGGISADGIFSIFKIVLSQAQLSDMKLYNV